MILLGIALPAQALAQGAKPFFEAKTIQVIVSSGAGATTDFTARLVARYLGKYIPGNPNVVAHQYAGRRRACSGQSHL